MTEQVVTDILEANPCLNAIYIIDETQNGHCPFVEVSYTIIAF